MKTDSRRTIHRREVLKRLAAAGCAAPMFVPGSALGAEEKAAASERITVGHIGVGNRGSALFREVQQVPDFQSVAASDCYQNRREGVARICKGKAYADFRELLARNDIDAVYIATPDHWHVPIGILAAKAGKDVYIEKPLGVTLQEDVAIEKVLADTGRIFQYGTQQRSLAHCWNGCELVRRGAIGKVHTIEVDAPNGGAGGSTAEAPLPDGFDFDMWCGPAPARAYTTDLCKPPGTYWVYDYSIGYLGGWGAHPLDIMVWGSDADVSGLVTVEGTGVVPGDGLYDTVYNWDMKIKLGDVELIFRPGADRTKFIGSDGWIQVARSADRNLASDPALVPTKPAAPLAPNDDSLQVSHSHSGNFAAAIRARKAPVSNIRDAVRSDVISLLCDIAVRTGEKITWDPAKRELVNPGADAQAMFSRKMRVPWTL
ncbi:MAG: Gfo/Idh/MocA family oxidoreductase [Rhodopirellula sp.]|nr:Gfo/Idh/MocA family oxidoreductase [Rhodopirellula sp.]